MKQATRELKPHFLCTYLYELATEFSSFYNQEKVMIDDVEAKELAPFTLCIHPIGPKNGVKPIGH